MNKEEEIKLIRISTGFDVILSIIAFIVSFYLHNFLFGISQIFSIEYIALLLYMIPVWVMLIHLFKLHNIDKKNNIADILSTYILFLVTGLALIFLFISILKLNVISRIVIFLFISLYFVLLLIARKLFITILKKHHKEVFFNKRIIIYADETAGIYINKIANNEFTNIQIVAIVTDSNNLKEKYSNKYQVFSKPDSLEDFLRNENIDELLYIRNDLKQNELEELVFICKEIGVSFRIQADILNLIASRGYYYHFDDFGTFTLPATSTDTFALVIKTIFDYVFSLLFLILSSPFLLVIAILIKLTSPGPIFFKQTRLGLRGRKFTMYKFRTMVKNAEELKETLLTKNESDGPVFKIKKDPRLTKIGGFLRKTSIDEIPQFFNVLLGQMSVIGPRPPLPSEVQKYKNWQFRKLSMKPGITCIWQVSGRNNIKFEEWMKLDLQYIDTWTIKLDFIIYIRTILTVFKMNGH